MSKAFIKIFALCLSLTIVISLCGCSGSGAASGSGAKAGDNGEKDRVSMFVGLGNNEAYYRALHEAIEENLGYDVKFIYQNTSDTTNSARLQCINNDYPADIMITASASPLECLQGKCLDLLTCSNITEKFTYSKVKECTMSDGCVYQLPFTSRLIGITYNKTLLDEMGWKEPQTFDDLKALKESCSEAGITFAVSGGAATGHGFNYLFNVMGAQWISTLEGTDWLENFLQGNVTVNRLAAQSEYFREFVKAGIFDNFHDKDWDSSGEFTEKRALIYFNYINDTYKGIRYTEDGKIYGAEYNEDGSVKAVKDDQGAFVLIDDKWCIYDPLTVTDENAERYNIPGASIDEYASMPWISEDGSNNCFTYYDNMFLSLSSWLGESDQKAKLSKCQEIMDFLTTETATEIYTEMYVDGYVATTDFEVTDDRFYSLYGEDISVGYMQPWYYNYFDADTIVNTGDVVNRYIRGDSDVKFTDIFDTLEQKNRERINAIPDTAGDVSETMGFEDLARFEAVCGAIDLQEKLDNGLGEKSGLKIQAAMMPYTRAVGDMAPWSGLGVVNVKMYAGNFDPSLVNAYIPANARFPSAVYLTGAEIKSMAENGLDKAEDLGYDGSVYGPYPFAVMFRSDSGVAALEELEDSEEYLVAVNQSAFTDDRWQELLDEGKVVLEKDTGDADADRADDESAEDTPLTGTLSDGILTYFDRHGTVGPDDIHW